MSAQVFQRAARRSLCSSHRLLSRRARAGYSQSALSPTAHCVQGVSASAVLAEKAETSTRNDSFPVATNAENPLGLDRYLASIRTANLDPTLDDLERCKPQSFSRPDSSRYAAEYTNLLETLCRSFSKDQLRHFTELYRLDPIWTRSSRRKTEYAESVIEKAWGWPSLKEIERKRRDTTEMLVKSFTVTPSQLFLIMGKDGADLLQLSMQFNVHISLTSSPLALRVEGLRGSLKGVTEHISSLKKGIIEKIFELPSGRSVRTDLLQRISRISGVYVENHGNRGKVRACAKDFNDIATAEKLALRASLEIRSHQYTVCYDPPSKKSNSPMEISEPQSYAIYPFTTPFPFPWTMRSCSAFRLRRVADWLGLNRHEHITCTGGLADNSDRLLNLNRGGEELSQIIHSTLPRCASYRRRAVTASLGHVLIPSGDNLRRESIFPPLRGTLSLPDALEWVETSGASLTFVPSIPPALTTVTIDGQRRLHRLIYRTLPQTVDQVVKSPQYVLKFEMELSCPPSTSPPPTQPFEYVRKSDDMLSSRPESFHSSQAIPSLSGAVSETLNSVWDASCQVGREAYVNLMLPDRSIDLQLHISDWDDRSLMQLPRVLQEYANELRNFLTNEPQSLRPDPPLTFSYEGKAYYLHESLNSSQGESSEFLSTVSNDCYVGDTVKIVTENIQDLQGDQKMGLFQATYGGTTEGPSWKSFLAACDQLTVASLESRSKKDQTICLEK